MVDFTYYTKSLLDIVTNNALIGFVLVITALFFFLNLYTAFWVAVGIPLSVLASYLFFPMFDITTNQIMLMTIIMVLGMLVDDAIVVAENITRHQEEGMDFKEAVVIGTQEMAKPVLATILTTILCFVLMYFMKGILGKFIVAIPTVVILTLTMSFFESITILPAHLSWRKRRENKQGSKKWIISMREHYGRALYFFLEHKKKTFSAIIIGTLLTVGVLGNIAKFELFPTEDFDLFYIIMETPTGSSLEETHRKVKEIEKEVAKIPPELMINFKSNIGHHRTDEAVSDPALHENWALTTVYLHPASKRNVRSEEIIEDLQKAAAHIKGFTKLDIRELKDGPPVGAPINLKVVSDDFTICEQYEKEIMGFLESTDGVYDITSTNLAGKKEVRLKLDYEKMAKLGINATDIAHTIRMAYDGIVATTIRKDGEEIDFRVKLSDKYRTQIETLQKLQILNNQNHLIKIERFVSFEEGISKQAITHYGGKKSLTIKAKVHTDKITSAEANQAIRDKFLAKINKEAGISLVFGGEDKETMESMENFIMAFLCALIGIYFVLILLLNSYLQPLLIMIAIPFGFVGVVFAFWLHGLPMSFIGMIGTLGMIGVVVNDSLVMVTNLNAMRNKHGKVTKKLIVEGAKTRLRPVLLTTVTTILGLLPTVYGWGGTEPFIVPMVLAMSWGLAFATLITLVLIPMLYTLIKEDAPQH